MTTNSGRPVLDGHVITPEQEAGFWEKVDRDTDPDGCWLWKAASDKDGYGKFRLGGDVRQAHRIAYVLVKGLIPKEMVVRHGPMCEEHPHGTGCVNPDHLMPGTHKDNEADKQGGWFRLDLNDIPMSGPARDITKAFLPHAEAILGGPDIHPTTSSGKGEQGDAGRESAANGGDRGGH